MSSCCLTIADLMTDAAEEVVDTIGVTVSYYPQVLTGYNTATTVRTPSEATVVSLDGVFTNLRLTAPEDTIARTASFWFPYAATLGFEPTALDRLVISSRSYRATSVEVDQIGATPSSYTLTLASD